MEMTPLQRWFTKWTDRPLAEIGWFIMCIDMRGFGGTMEILAARTLPLWLRKIIHL